MPGASRKTSSWATSGTFNQRAVAATSRSASCTCREESTVAKLRHGDERDEQVAAFDMTSIGRCYGGTSLRQLGAEDIRVYDSRRQPGDHASAMALRKASSSSSVRPSITMSS